MKQKFLILILALATVVCRAQDFASANVLVTDFSDVPISGAQIQFFDTKKNVTVTGVSDGTGKFIVELAAGWYNIRLKSVGMSKDYSAIEIPALGPNEVYNNINIIIQYEEASSFTLSNLHFETNKSVIKKASFDELDELVNYLKLKPELKIEIGGHTDNEGSEASNLTLSDARAKAVKKYLISKGIKADRMVAKGYGEANPIAENDSENGRALNRRTEIQILE
ncbi:MAG: outer membrane protein OmpA-like peptidoglycan-associated protein [Crocinitomix sp.]|jgi:outer membrane protein OmpA-like peptidoglycan-associated protein